MAQAPLELAAVKRFDGLDLPLQVHDGVGEVDEAQFAARHVLDDVRAENLGLGLPGHEQAKHVPVGGIARVLPQGPVDVEAGIAPPALTMKCSSPGLRPGGAQPRPGCRSG